MGKRPSLVAEVMQFIRRYVVLSEAQNRIVALWVIHTHCVEVFEQTPYLAVTSPEKGCGKTRLIETINVLVARPWQTVTPSEAVLYRKIARDLPTLLMDEVDTIFSPRAADRYEGHRAILNAGHRRGNKVARCVGSSNEIEDFEAYCAKLLAGIGALPDTVADRSVPIRMERRKKSEPVSRFILRDVEPEAEALRERIAEWVAAHGEDLGNARPSMPDELSDRMQEGCEPLIAIADALKCGKKARAALLELLSGERLDDHESLRLRLLRDIRSVFQQRDEERGKRVKGIATVSLIAALRDMEEAPWALYYGRGIDPNDLSNLLHHYGIKPTTIRVRKGEKPRKGYKRDALHEAWERYL
jgi:Protein of unknown function (DUF3631)